MLYLLLDFTLKKAQRKRPKKKGTFPPKGLKPYLIRGPYPGFFFFLRGRGRTEMKGFAFRGLCLTSSKMFFSLHFYDQFTSPRCVLRGGGGQT